MQAHLRASRFLLALCLAACSAAGTTDTAAGNDPGNQPQASGGESLDGRRPFPADNPWNTDDQRGAGRSELVDADRVVRSPESASGFRHGLGRRAERHSVRRRALGPSRRCRCRSTTPTRAIPGRIRFRPTRRSRAVRASTGDRHVLVIDADTWKLYELFDAHPRERRRELDGRLRRDLRPQLERAAPRRLDVGRRGGAADLSRGWCATTRSVEQQAINHALRFTCPRTRKAYVAAGASLREQRHEHQPAADGDARAPQGELRHRRHSRRNVQVILRAMKTYGMFVADNGTDWYVSGAPDPRWSDDDLATLSRVPSSAFEVVK